MGAGWSEWEVIYNDKWTCLFRKIVLKRLPRSAEVAEETMQEVRQELAIKLSQLDAAPHSPDSYLKVAFRHTLEDYLRLKHGYPRPPELIKRLGAIYVRIYKLLCLERRSINEIHAMMKSLFQYTRQYVDQVVSEVRAGVVDCGGWRESVSLENTATEVDVRSIDIDNKPEDLLERMDMDAIINTVLGNESAGTSYSDSIEKILSSIKQCIGDDDERLLLRLVYTDGHSISAAAKILKLPDAKARKLLKNVILRVKQVLDHAE